MKTFDELLENYAQVAVEVGVNLQKGQILVLQAPVEAKELVRKIVRRAYEKGAKYVHVELNDEQLTYIKFTYAPEEAFTFYPMWRAKGFEEMAAEGAAFLQIYSPNPDLLKDVDPKRYATAAKTAGTALKAYKSYLMEDKAPWSLISAPTESWAKKVFPDLPVEKAIDLFWGKIFSISRVNTDDPIAAWKTHNEQLHRKVAELNEKQYKQLIYTAPGTNLTIELPENHRWNGGFSLTPTGIPFNPNIPTEEVFTMPHREGVNGVVRSTKPLNYGGNLIENFSFTFKNGKVVDFAAEKGYETLKHLLDTDEGARYLGEVALVPHDSPISNSNILFYNTLYDENASCHLALGEAYPTCLTGGEKMSKEELKAAGANDSLIHEDFMIGSAELNIDGITKDGKREAIFRNGNWA
ncbi:aminopeptidase [Thermicanus aegyptius]|uniref:aminopeptidase n=1 Tax=Thermicanus aegyptius TaxID=94009 RepID=UPI000418B527|nr:aminopeptidase [Thermicanus aegyptius]